MPDKTDTELLLEIHDSISSVKAFNGRLDERTKSLESFRKYLLGIVAGLIISIGAALVIAALKGVF